MFTGSAQEDLFHRYQDDVKVQEPDENISWFGQPIISHQGKLSQLKSFLPRFERKDFGKNEFLDMIVRKPKENEPPVSVAAVSKNYVLVQHVDLLDALRMGVGAFKLDPEDLEGTLTLSKYGERMRLSLEIPGFVFDPGDGNPIVLKIECLNSVDKSTALVLRFKWERLVCGNGMVFGIKDSRIRKIHNSQCLTLQNFRDFFEDHLKRVPDEYTLYKDWLRTRLEVDSLVRWVDGPLADTWGPHAAARAFFIAKTGCDGKVSNPSLKALPHKREITKTKVVPGACAPVKNAFHLS